MCIVCFPFRLLFACLFQFSINKAVQLDMIRKKYPRESIKSLKSARYHTTIYLVSRTNIDSRFEISVNVCATCKMDRSMVQKIKPQKTFHIKGKKESRKWRSGYAICQWCDISRFPWIDIANISQSFYFTWKSIVALRQ